MTALAQLSDAIPSELWSVNTLIVISIGSICGLILPHSRFKITSRIIAVVMLLAVVESLLLPRPMRNFIVVACIIYSVTEMGRCFFRVLKAVQQFLTGTANNLIGTPRPADSQKLPEKNNPTV